MRLGATPCTEEAIAMTEYHLQFWRGQERVFDYESDEFDSLDEARCHIDELIEAMRGDPSGEDWTGCRFDVATVRGKTVLQVPVLAAMSALARGKAH
jgi:hypothetical protein